MIARVSVSWTLLSLSLSSLQELFPVSVCCFCWCFFLLLLLLLLTMDPDQVARAFVEHYYSIFDSNRSALASLYQDASMLTFEGQKFAGGPSIVAKLTGLSFQQCKHHVSTIDCQPSGPGGGMLVFVSGNMQLPGEDHPLKFSQVFR